MEIKYEEQENFYRGIVECVKAGLMFEANGDELTITLTGGY